MNDDHERRPHGASDPAGPDDSRPGVPPKIAGETGQQEDAEVDLPREHVEVPTGSFGPQMIGHEHRVPSTEAGRRRLNRLQREFMKQGCLTALLFSAPLSLLRLR